MSPTSFLPVIVVAILMVFAIMRDQPGVLRPKPPEIRKLDDWSFDSFPIPRFEELSQDERDWKISILEEVPNSDYCATDIRLRYNIYQERYPRFQQFADDPKAFQRFLHRMALRADQEVVPCSVVHLLARIFDEGTNRCNLNVLRDSNDPLLQRDIDKVIELVEYRHPLMVYHLLNVFTLINLNRVLWDTRYYLILIDAIDVSRKERPHDMYGSYELQRKFLLDDVPDHDPKRIAFIATAAKRNDFRSVLRTNKPCTRSYSD